MRAFLAVSLAVVSLVLDGCGGCNDDKGKQLPDGGLPIDMAPDMMVQAQPVTLTVTNLGQPMPDVTVYFVNADDSLVKSTMTDATGTASAVIAAGGSVTAINPFTRVVTPAAPKGGIVGDELRTFLGVKPGDHLVLTRTVSETVTLQLNASAAEGANTYDVFTTCGTSNIVPGGGGGGSGSPDPGGPVTLTDCHDGADIAILARLHTIESDDNIAGLYHADATVMDDHTLDLAADPYTALTTLTFTFMNTPDANLDVKHAPIAKHGAIGPFIIDAPGGSGTIQEPTMPGVTKALVDLSLFLNSRHEVVDWGAYTTDYTLDLGAVLLSEITAVSSFDVATSKLSWTEDSTGATPDLTVASASFTRSEPSFHQWHWELAAPHPTTTEIKLPKLPTDVFDWNLSTGDSSSQEAVTGIKLPGGYDAGRAHIFDVFDRRAFTDLVAGASGRAVIVQSVATQEGGAR